MVDGDVANVADVANGRYMTVYSHEVQAAGCGMPLQPQSQVRSLDTHQSGTRQCRGRWPGARPSPGLALKNNDSQLTFQIEFGGCRRRQSRSPSYQCSLRPLIACRLSLVVLHSIQRDSTKIPVGVGTHLS